MPYKCLWSIYAMQLCYTILPRLAGARIFPGVGPGVNWSWCIFLCPCGVPCGVELIWGGRIWAPKSKPDKKTTSVFCFWKFYSDHLKRHKNSMIFHIDNIWTDSKGSFYTVLGEAKHNNFERYSNLSYWSFFLFHVIRNLSVKPRYHDRFKIRYKQV